MKDYSDILAFEKKYVININQINLLGEIIFTPDEIDYLGSLIKNIVSDDVQQGTKFLETNTPTCLSCFLVGKGMFDYQLGDFWSSVEKSTGILDPNWQTKWGEIFIKFLRFKKLQILEIKDSHKYVTNILFHGMIPNSCLYEFFSDVLLPLVENELVSCSPKEINFVLNRKRNDESKRIKIIEEINDLERTIASIHSENAIQGTGDLNVNDEKTPLYDEIVFRKNDIELKVQECGEHIEEIEKLKHEYQDAIECFSEDDKHLLASSDFISHSKNALLEIESMWDEYILYCLQKSKDIIDKEKSKYIIEIKNSAEDIGLNITNDLVYIVAKMHNKLNDVKEHKKKAEIAQREIEKTNLLLIEVTNLKMSLENDLRDIEEQLTNIEKNVETSGESKQLQRASKEQNLLNEDFAIFDTLLIEDQIYELKILLQQLPKPFPYVDEPIRRFLLYGGNFADHFILQSIKMLKKIREERNTSDVDDIDLPERVIIIFKKWWIEYEDRIEEKQDFASNNGLNKLKNPVIYYDDSEGIIVRFPTQRFKVNTSVQDFCLEINANQPDSHVEKLRAYALDDNRLETEEIDFKINLPSDYYEFQLKAGNDIINTNIVKGISTNRPFMVFDYDSKKLIQEHENIKNNILIVSHNKFNLEPENAVFEEGELSGGWQDYVYRAIDLQNVNQLSLIDNAGNKIPILISKKRLQKTVLKDGEALVDVHSNGLSIYTEPPTIEFDVNIDDDLNKWVLSIHLQTDNSLSESFYQLNELDDILQINLDTDKCKIPLINEKFIGNSTAGQFIVRLKNDRLKIDKQFNFWILPNLTVKFDKNIYLPDESGTADVYLIVSGSNGLKFKPHNSAELVNQREDASEIKTNTSEIDIYGDLEYPLSNLSKEKTIILPLNFHIPKLSWRIEGFKDEKYTSDSNKIIEMSDDIFEKQIDEKLLLTVSMPPFIKGNCQLSLSNSEQNSVQKLIDGIATFELLPFYDTLRASEAALQLFEITVFDAKPALENVPLFSVRKWQIQNIECVQKSTDGVRILEILWDESGTSKNRIMRLWHLKDNPTQIHEEKIEGKTTNVLIEKNENDIPPGRYLIQFTKKDSWMHTNNPYDISYNSKEILIGIDDTYLLDVADKEFNNHNYIQAVQYYKEAQEKYPGLYSIWQHKLTGLIHTKKYKDAIDMSSQLVSYPELKDTDCFSIASSLVIMTNEKNIEYLKIEDVLDLLCLLTTIRASGRKFKLSSHFINNKSTFSNLLKIVGKNYSTECVEILRASNNSRSYNKIIKVIKQMKSV